MIRAVGSKLIVMWVCMSLGSSLCVANQRIGPDVRSEALESILAANTRGEELVGANDWEWEVLDDDGNVVC
jgi:hypothetical protein